MLLRTTKLEQMIAECDMAEHKENSNIANTLPAPMYATPQDMESVSASNKSTAVVQCTAANTVDNVADDVADTGISNADSLSDENNADVNAAETETLHNFKLMFSHRVAETVETLPDTQYTDGENFILYNVASCYTGKERIFEDLAVHTELPDIFIQRRELFDNTPLQSIGSIKAVYKEVKSAYKAGVKRYNEINKKNLCRGDDLRVLYMFSAWFNWQPSMNSKSGYAFNAARVWYALEYLGLDNITEIGVIPHTVQKDTVTVLRIRTQTETFYLMPRKAA